MALILWVDSIYQSLQVNQLGTLVSDTSKYKALIIDDDPLIGDLLKHFCNKSNKFLYATHVTTGKEGLRTLLSGEFNILFLDYNLPDMKGKDFLEFLHGDIPVIMITSSDEFAAKSYDYEIIKDYMLKPLSFDRFLKSMAKIDTQSTKENQENSDDFFYIKDGNKYVRITFDQILFVRSESNYVTFILPNNQHMALMNLKDLEQKLPKQFIRIHRSYIINKNKISFLTTEEVTIGTHVIPIGDKYKLQVINSLQQL
ncbi:MAG TPA: LytTR family DNA-binding domain-containing protein [Saprospiraceae bacterium]|nr:LytTR family DNA-binding domain-containing protein [Saprospiraceae bacterium]